MMHVFVNGLAASAGGGVTYLRNVLPHLSARGDVQVTAALTPALRRELSGLPRVSFPEITVPAGALGRFWQEQRSLPAVIRTSGADVLLSAGNFALRNSPMPQILLSRNSLYTSADFFRDLLRRRDYGLWIDTRIKRSLSLRSVRWAGRTVAPSEAFARELRQATGCSVTALHHGFDREAFFRDQAPLAPQVQRKLDPIRRRCACSTSAITTTTATLRLCSRPAAIAPSDGGAQGEAVSHLPAAYRR